MTITRPTHSLASDPEFRRLGTQFEHLNDDELEILLDAVMEATREAVEELASKVPVIEGMSEETLGREVRSMGYRKLSARPRHHAQDAEAAEAFKKTSPPLWQKSPPVPPRAK